MATTAISPTVISISPALLGTGAAYRLATSMPEEIASWARVSDAGVGTTRKTVWRP
jgi:hypothetical protein